MSKNYYVSGENNLICDSCGKKIKLHEARVRWDGLVVCLDDFEERQPQDFVKPRQDKITVPLVRPRPTDVFVTLQCTWFTHLGMADYGTADCAWADNAPDFDWRDWAAEYCSPQGMSGVAGIAIAGCAKPSKYTSGYL